MTPRGECGGSGDQISHERLLNVETAVKAASVTTPPHHHAVLLTPTAFVAAGLCCCGRPPQLARCLRPVEIARTCSQRALVPSRLSTRFTVSQDRRWRNHCGRLCTLFRLMPRRLEQRALLYPRVERLTHPQFPIIALRCSALSPCLLRMPRRTVVAVRLETKEASNQTVVLQWKSCEK